jgi:predicted nucleotidyltransferase
VTRGEGKNYSKIYLKKALRAAGLLKIIPSILLVGIAGSLATGKATKKSDIDFFIVCKTGRIFSSRFYAKLILGLVGWARRNHDRNPAGKICLNYFLSEDSLDFKPHNAKVVDYHRRSIILFSRGGVLSDLVKANKWLKPDFQLKYHRKHHLSFYTNRLGDSLERFFKRYQCRLIEADPRTFEFPNRIIYTDQELRFHPPKKSLVE